MAPPHEFFQTSHKPLNPVSTHWIMAPPHEFFQNSHKPLNPVSTPDFDQENISLRSFVLSDIDAYMTWAGDEKVHQFFDSPPLSTKEGLEELENETIPHPWYKAICLSGLPIGYVKFDQPQCDEEDCIGLGEIGYGLAAKYWGKGITTTAVKLAVSAIFKELGHIQDIVAFIVKENVSSRKVVKKAGFEILDVFPDFWTVQGKKRDVVLYSLSRTDLDLI